MYITELDGVGDPVQITEAMAQLIRSNNFVSITFFEPFKPPEGPDDPWQNVLYTHNQRPTPWYYLLLQQLLK